MAEEHGIRERPEGGEETLMELTQVVMMETKERVLSPSLAASAGVGEAGGVKRRRVTEGDFELSCRQLRSRRISQGPSPEKGSNGEDRDQTSRFAGEARPAEEVALPAAAAATETATEVRGRRKTVLDDGVSVPPHLFRNPVSNYDRELERDEATMKDLRRKEAEDMESAARPADAGGRCKMEAPPPATSPVTSLVASEREIEEFFASAERKERERFSKKYNYDVVKDSPLEGRYEWTRIEP
ncbi:unnamed protein product [Spirodela intermedia]|uniref:Cyclin-dependent kinase inhibitor domain-containing protein n=1 Tax=Spirodela intermedia TaxID=51605 RepID=A0A7I8J2Q7_SPIIN|nr:unnamed protein product [Spirodela intermedia]CAA6664339.1 unnamed protein product [Spirodela intermedia]